MSTQHLLITFLIIVLIYLYSFKETFNQWGGNKSYLSKGQKFNSDIRKKIKQKMAENCQNINSDKIKSNNMINKRMVCRYLSRCKDLGDINYISWNKPKIASDNKVRGVPSR
jgi:hypothetical protein